VIIASLRIGLANFINPSVIALSPMSRFVWLPASVLALATMAYALATRNTQSSLTWM